MTVGGVWQIASGAPWLETLADWLVEEELLPENTFIFVPSSRAAAGLAQAVAARKAGVLPYILPLRGSSELALALGLPVPQVADAWVVRGLVLDCLCAQDDVPPPALLTRQAEDLMGLLNRLEAYGLDERRLERCVPKALALHWQRQAALLGNVRARVLAEMNALSHMLPGTAERHVLEVATTALKARPGARVVVAGVLDAPPAAVGLARLATETGAVFVPEKDGCEGELVARWLGKLGVDGSPQPLGAVGGAQVFQLLGRDVWDEAAQVAAVVKKALLDNKRVAVIAPNPTVAQCMEATLQVQGVTPHMTGGVTLAQTPAGRSLLMEMDALPPQMWGYGGRARDMAYWVTRLEKLFPHHMEPGALGEPALLSMITDKLAVLGGVWTAAGVQALVRYVVTELVADTMAGAPVTPGVQIMTPLEARLLAPECVVICHAVDADWPGMHVDPWLGDGQLRALGLPDAALKARLGAAEWQGLVAGGAKEVYVSRPLTEQGQPCPPSRLVQGHAWPVACVAWQRRDALPKPVLGAFVPTGEMFPRRWSASFVEGLMHCPYRAYAERFAKILPLPPLVPIPDARQGGLVAHTWLKRAAAVLPKRLEAADADTAERLLKDLADAVLAREDPVIQAIWRRRFAKLAPALVALWIAGERSLLEAETRIETSLPAPHAHVVCHATPDRLDVGEDGIAVVDFKTTTPPAWADVRAGLKPQLPLEAWILAQTQERPVKELAFWHLRGYGRAMVNVLTPTQTYPLDDLLAPVAEGLERLADTFGNDESRFEALPDMSGGGLMASGMCATCPLAGVCRRHAVVADPLAGEVRHA